MMAVAMTPIAPADQVEQGDPRIGGPQVMRDIIEVEQDRLPATRLGTQADVVRLQVQVIDTELRRRTHDGLQRVDQSLRHAAGSQVPFLQGGTSDVVLHEAGRTRAILLEHAARPRDIGSQHFDGVQGRIAREFVGRDARLEASLVFDDLRRVVDLDHDRFLSPPS